MPGGLESGPRSPWMALISPHLALEEKGPVLEATVALWRSWWLLFPLLPAITLTWYSAWSLLRFPAEEFPPGTELIGKLENHHRTGSEYPEVQLPPWSGLGV